MFRIVLAIFALLNAVFPVCLCFGNKKYMFYLHEDQVGIVAAVHECLCSAGVFLLLRFSSSNKYPSWYTSFVGCFIFLSLADLAFGLDMYIFKIPPPRGYWPLIHEMPYAFFSILASLALFGRAVQNTDKKEKALVSCFIAFMSLIFVWLSYFLILKPFFLDTIPRPSITYLPPVLYAVGISILTVSLFVASMRAMGWVEFIVWSLFLIMVGSDFALRYQYIWGVVRQISFFEYGWYLAETFLFSILLVNRFFFKKNKMVIFYEPSPLSSVRVITAAFSLISLLGFVGIVWVIGAMETRTSPIHVGTDLLILSAVWLASNFAGISISQAIRRRSESLSRELAAISDIEEISNIALPPSELSSIVFALRSVQIKLRESQDEAREMHSKIAVAQVVRQVAHDIQSPLAALSLAAQSANELNEDIRILIRAAIARIFGIASDLLKLSKNSLASKDDQRKPALLSSLVIEIVREKKLQFQHEVQVKIDSEVSHNTYGLFACIQKEQFKRVLSNLINNSVEAISGAGFVEVRLEEEHHRALISIIDSGRGIPPDILGNLGQEGHSYGKAKGNGLGLYHAKSVIESNGGCISLSSNGVCGTRVEIKIDVIDPPASFLRELQLGFCSRLIILDDDISIHHVWKSRVNRSVSLASKITVYHFYNSAEFMRWVSSAEVSSRDFFLMDFELIGSELTGLDIIINFNLASQSVIVTSSFDEVFKKVELIDSKIKVIPKSIAPFIEMME